MAGKFQFTSRTKARKRAADVVFEADQRGMGHNPMVLRDLLRERKVITAALTPLPEYSITLIEGVAAELRRIDRLIADHSQSRDFDRIPAVDLAVMRVAVWEMLSDDVDVPAVIAIDEAVSIVKAVSTDDSPNFVNAVLDAIRRDLGQGDWQRQRVTSDESSDFSVSHTVTQSSPNGGEAEELSFADFAAGLAKGDIVAADESEIEYSEVDELLDEY